MTELLKRTEFGNPILQQPAPLVDVADITSKRIQDLIANMRRTLKEKKLGVGIAAPQLNVHLALSVIDITPSKTRPNVTPFTQVIINPEVIEGIGPKEGMWEGCLSFGTVNSPVFAKADRYKKIKVRFYDEHGVLHDDEVLKGFPAHVFQHETDHLNGILFPTRVSDHTTWMNAAEYRKRITSKK
ncbi:MAG: peptide deformylase [Candidatus Microsaccharimonas sp.]